MDKSKIIIPRNKVIFFINGLRPTSVENTGSKVSIFHPQTRQNVFVEHADLEGKILKFIDKSKIPFDRKLKLRIKDKNYVYRGKNIPFKTIERNIEVKIYGFVTTEKLEEDQFIHLYNNDAWDVEDNFKIGSTKRNEIMRRLRYESHIKHLGWIIFVISLVFNALVTILMPQNIFFSILLSTTGALILYYFNAIYNSKIEGWD